VVENLREVPGQAEIAHMLAGGLFLHPIGFLARLYLSCTTTGAWLMRLRGARLDGTPWASSRRRYRTKALAMQAIRRRLTPLMMVPGEERQIDAVPLFAEREGYRIETASGPVFFPDMRRCQLCSGLNAKECAYKCGAVLCSDCGNGHQPPDCPPQMDEVVAAIDGERPLPRSRKAIERLRRRLNDAVEKRGSAARVMPKTRGSQKSASIGDAAMSLLFAIHKAAQDPATADKLNNAADQVEALVLPRLAPERHPLVTMVATVLRGVAGLRMDVEAFYEAQDSLALRHQRRGFLRLLRLRGAERLDYSWPPAGYTLHGEHEWSVDSTGYWGSNGTDADSRKHTGLTRAWTHFKANSDPPGLTEIFQCAGRVDGKVVRGWKFRFGIASDEALYPDREAARAAAWAWHDRRHALAELLGRVAASIVREGDAWPRILTWADKQVAEVERWLRDSTAEMPEVLRG
jgi:hypothetical protein